MANVLGFRVSLALIVFSALSTFVNGQGGNFFLPIDSPVSFAQTYRLGLNVIYVMGQQYLEPKPGEPCVYQPELDMFEAVQGAPNNTDSLMVYGYCADSSTYEYALVFIHLHQFDGPIQPFNNHMPVSAMDLSASVKESESFNLISYMNGIDKPCEMNSAQKYEAFARVGLEVATSGQLQLNFFPLCGFLNVHHSVDLSRTPTIVIPQ